MAYYKTNEVQLNRFDESKIQDLYRHGYLLTRVSKGNLIQTRSLRINLEKFDLNSENRRILRKTENLEFEYKDLPIVNYDWTIHKLGKDFYTEKFGDKTMSASKVKEMFTDEEKSNMNGFFEYKIDSDVVGYCLVYKGKDFLHYAYPFYKLELVDNNMGLGMMIRAIEYAKSKGLKYIYLGSIVDASAKYKLQFKGLEWWNNDVSKWSEDFELLKSLIH